MKHYLTYESDGSISGKCSYQHAATGLRGWPEEYELDNPNTEHALSREWLMKTKRPPTGGYIRYDCPCPRTAQQCNCASVMRMTKYVENGQLTDKIATVCTVDGVPVTSGQVVSRPPGTPIVLRFEFPGAPDGEPIALMQMEPMIFDTPERTLPMAVNAGAIEATAYAPAQGLTGIARVFSRICTMLEVRIRGWGAA